MRTSKVKNATAIPYKPDKCYDGLNVSNATLDANAVAASGRYVAVAVASGTGGAVAILPLERTGKFIPSEVPTLQAHAAQVYDFAFSPFDDALLGTVADDASVKLWHIPDECDVQDVSPVATLQGHGRRVATISFHPCAASVVATSSHDKTVRVWDVEKQSEAVCLDGFGDVIQSVDWSYDGRLLATTCKDKKLRIFDPRSGSIVREGAGPPGLRGSRICWLGATGRVVTTGYSQFRDREVTMYDASNVETPLWKQSMGTSTGLLMPFFDNDTNLLFTAGKGDCSVTMFEVVEDKPFIYDVSTSMTRDPQRGVCMLPKCAVDVMKCEIVRLLKVAANGVCPIMIQVPRKSYQRFHEDLFPDTRGGEPMMSAEEWFEGSNTPPKFVSLDPALRPKPSAPEQQAAEETPPTPAASGVKEEPPAGPSAIAQKEISESPEPSQTSSKRVSLGRHTKFRHTRGVTANKNLFIDGLRVETSRATDTNLIESSAHDKYFAVPWVGPGGIVAVFPLDTPGRVATDAPFIDAHTAPIVDFHFHPYDDQILATGSDDCHVKVWRIPDEGLTTTMHEPQLDLVGHPRKICTVSFHPTAADILVTSGGENTLRIWDVSKGQEVHVLEGHDDNVISMSWSYDGGILATSCRDKKLRIIDPRGEGVVSSVEAHAGPRGFRVVWLGDTPNVFTTGFGQYSQRQLAMWDTRNLDTPLTLLDTETSAGVLLPFYDPDTRIMYVGGKGDVTVKLYECLNQEPWLDPVNDYKSLSPQMGITMLSKACCDVKSCEIARLLRLTGPMVEPFSFTVPRTRTEFFQDDIFPDTWDGKEVMNAEEWCSGVCREPNKIPLKPEGMIPLSEAPEEQKTVSKYRGSTSRQRMPTEKETFQAFQSSVMGMAQKFYDSGKPTPDQLPVDKDMFPDDDWDE